MLPCIPRMHPARSATYNRAGQQPYRPCFSDVHTLRSRRAHLALHEVAREAQLLGQRQHERPQAREVLLERAPGHLDQVAVQLHARLALLVLPLVHAPVGVGRAGTQGRGRVRAGARGAQTKGDVGQTGAEEGAEGVNTGGGSGSGRGE